MNKLKKLFSLGFKEAFKYIKNKILFEKTFSFFESLGIHVLPVHYYSPIPDTRELRKRLNQWHREWSFTGVDFNLKGQIDLLKQLERYKTEQIGLPPYQEISSQGYGEGFGEEESAILYSMVRHVKPKLIIEVGSGDSTVYSSLALFRNKEIHKQEAKLVCIEPYPRPALVRLKNNGVIELQQQLVQDIPLDFFKALQINDVLFIDSSHILKLNSDVNYLYLDVLPNLNKGVIIHIHDIRFPYLESKNYEYWLFHRHQFWNETSLLYAFLTFNSAFEIILCSSYLHYKHPHLLQNTFPIYDPNKHFPSSIWLRKVE